MSCTRACRESHTLAETCRCSCKGANHGEDKSLHLPFVDEVNEMTEDEMHAVAEKARRNKEFMNRKLIT